MITNIFTDWTFNSVLKKSNRSKINATKMDYWEKLSTVSGMNKNQMKRLEDEWK